MTWHSPSFTPHTGAASAAAAVKSAGFEESTGWQPSPRYDLDVASGWQALQTAEHSHVLSQAVGAGNGVTSRPVLALSSGTLATAHCQPFCAPNTNDQHWFLARSHALPPPGSTSMASSSFLPQWMPTCATGNTDIMASHSSCKETNTVCKTTSISVLKAFVRSSTLLNTDFIRKKQG